MEFTAQNPGTYAFCLDNRKSHFFPQYLQVRDDLLLLSFNISFVISSVSSFAVSKHAFFLLV
jgi:hypothetical protein